jgi:hypothetical protein
MAKQDLSQRTFRCSFTLPVDLATDLSDVAKSLGISQSSLVTHILHHPLTQLAMRVSVFDPVESDTTEGSKRTLRLRGASAEQIETLIRQALSDALIQPDRGSLL